MISYMDTVNKITEVGILCDRISLRNTKESFENLLSCELSKINSIEPKLAIKFNSSKVVSEYFSAFPILEEFPILARDEKLSFGKDTLNLLSSKYPVANNIRLARSYSRVIKSIDNLSSFSKLDGRFHPNFGESVQGRLFTDKPNLINMPKCCRTSLVADPGCFLIYGDYKSEEFLILAKLAGEDSVFDMIDTGIDVFDSIVDLSNQLLTVERSESLSVSNPITRQAVKVIVYGSSYGQSPEGLAISQGISIHEASVIQKAYEARFPKIASYLSDLRDRIHTSGESSTEILQGKLRVNNSLPSGQELSHEINRGVSFKISGTAADFMKLILSSDEFHRGLSAIEGTILLPIFDALIIQAPKSNAEAASKLVKYIMEKIPSDFGFKQYVNPKVVSNWGEVDTTSQSVDSGDSED